MPCKVEKKSYLDSYEVALDGVKKADPSISDHEARIKTAEFFRPRFKEWREAEKIEKEGKRDYQNGEFAMDDKGKMYFPKTGEYAEGFHKNQQRLSELHDSPEEYSLEDHQTTQLLQSAIFAGATRVVTSFGRNDGKNRDILEYTYDPVMNKGRIRVLNTESEGSFHSAGEIRKIAKEKFSGFSEVTSTSGVFVLTDKPISEKIVIQVIDGAGYAMRRTTGEMKYTARSVQRYFEMKQGKRLIPMAPDYLKDPKSQDVWTKLIQTSKNKVSTEGIKIRNKKELIQQKKVAENVPVFAFANINRLEKHSVQPMKKAVEKSVARHVRKEMKKTVKKRIELMPILHKETKQKFHKVKKDVVFFKELFNFKKKLKKKEEFLHKQTEIKKRETVKKERVVSLFVIFKKIVRQKEKILFFSKKTNEKTYSTKKEQKKAERMHVLDFSIAFIFWKLLLRDRYHVPLHDSKIKHGGMSEAIITKEPTPWLLLAIIWYLVQIREAGVVSTNKNQGFNKNKKLKKISVFSYTQTFPIQGVIFAYAS